MGAPHAGFCASPLPQIACAAAIRICRDACEPSAAGREPVPYCDSAEAVSDCPASADENRVANTIRATAPTSMGQKRYVATPKFGAPSQRSIQARAATAPAAIRTEVPSVRRRSAASTRCASSPAAGGPGVSTMNERYGGSGNLARNRPDLPLIVRGSVDEVRHR